MRILIFTSLLLAVWGHATAALAQVLFVAGDVDVSSVPVGGGFEPNTETEDPHIQVAAESSTPVAGANGDPDDVCFDASGVGELPVISVGDACLETTNFDTDVSLVHFYPGGSGGRANGLIVMNQPILGYSFTSDCLSKSDDHINSRAISDAYPSNDDERGLEGGERVLLGRNRHVLRLALTTGESDTIDQLRVFTKHLDTEVFFQTCQAVFSGTSFSADLTVNGSDNRRVTLLVELPSEGEGCTFDGTVCEARSDVAPDAGAHLQSCAVGSFDATNSVLSGRLDCQWDELGTPTITLLGGGSPQQLSLTDCGGTVLDGGIGDAGPIDDAGTRDAGAGDAGPGVAPGTAFSGGAACSASTRGNGSMLLLLSGLFGCLLQRRGSKSQRRKRPRN